MLPVVDLSDVRESHDACRQRDVISLQSAGHSPTVPAREHLLQRPLDRLTKPEPLGELTGQLAVCGHGLGHGPPAGEQNLASQARPFHWRGA
jgi:hypothetical protein